MSLIHSVNIWRNFGQLNTLIKIECDHKELLLAYARKPSVTEILDAHDYKTFFNDAWDSVKTRFLTLRRFLWGIGVHVPQHHVSWIQFLCGKVGERCTPYMLN